MSFDKDDSVEMVPLGERGDNDDEKNQAMVLRAQMTAVLRPLSVSAEAQMDLLARIDNALESCAVATGGNGRQIHRAWQLGVQGFLRDL